MTKIVWMRDDDDEQQQKSSKIEETTSDLEHTCEARTDLMSLRAKKIFEWFPFQCPRVSRKRRKV